MKDKLARLLVSVILALNLVVSSPAYLLAAQEASDAGEAQDAPEAEKPSPVPSPVPSEQPQSSPSPSNTPQPTNSSEPDTNNQSSVGNNDQSGSGGYGSDGADEQRRRERRHERSGNDRSGNVGDTTITSGDAGASAAVNTSANRTTFSPGTLCSVCIDDVSVNNSANGEGSNNNADVLINNNSTVAIDNDADIGNSLNLDADSGGNRASRNVGDSEITTGDANVSGVVITSVNETGLGVVEYNILEDHNGDIILAVPDGLFGCGLCGPVGNVDAQN